MIRLLIADDHEIVRSGLRCLLEGKNNITVIAEAITGEDAVRLAQTLKPDVALMDLNMPNTDGFTASLQLRKLVPEQKILVISGQEDLFTPICLLKSGILGYISKGTDPDMLVNAIKTVHAKKQYYQDHKFLMTSIMSSPFEQLTAREMQITLMTIRGMESPTIAEKLFLTSKTVQKTVRNILKKLDLDRIIQIVPLAIQYKLIDPNAFQVESEM